MAKKEPSLHELVKLLGIFNLARAALGISRKMAARIIKEHGGGVLKSAVNSFQKILAGRSVDRRTLAKLPPELLRFIQRVLAGKKGN